MHTPALGDLDGELYLLIYANGIRAHIVGKVDVGGAYFLLLFTHSTWIDAN
jgi:hypothetical protein